MRLVIPICLLSVALNACCTDTDTIRAIQNQATAAKVSADNCMTDSSSLSGPGGIDTAKANIQKDCTQLQQALSSIADASAKLLQGR